LIQVQYETRGPAWFTRRLVAEHLDGAIRAVTGELMTRLAAQP